MSGGILEQTGQESYFWSNLNWTHRLGVDMMTASHRQQTRRICVETRLSVSIYLNPVRKLKANILERSSTGNLRNVSGIQEMDIVLTVAW